MKKHTHRKQAADESSAPMALPGITKSEFNAEFLKSLKLKQANDGANTHIEEFIRAMDNLTSSKQSFTRDDVRYFTQFTDLPTAETDMLFDRWTQEMMLRRKLEVVQGCYDDVVYISV
ncbi:MAG: hypothetical protein JWQ71_984 [Pedosphaera sp.]|nr:hypothetical protein [Pedosphaera sp.]